MVDKKVNMDCYVPIDIFSVPGIKDIDFIKVEENLKIEV